MDRKQEELTQREQIDQTLRLLEWNRRVVGCDLYVKDLLH